MTSLGTWPILELTECLHYGFCDGSGHPEPLPSSAKVKYDPFHLGRTIFAMAEEFSELLRKALALPPEARAALAGSLLESLDETVDPSCEEAWKKEIARRIEELDSGKVKPIPWAEARRQIAALLNGR